MTSEAPRPDDHRTRRGCASGPGHRAFLGHWILVIGICWSLFAAPRAAAQQQVLEEQQLAIPARANPDALGGRDAMQGVYVRDSAVAVEKLALAQRLEHLKQWDKSGDVYMEILQGYPDRVVPSEVDKDNRIYQYTSVAAAVQERLARWPEPGLQAYRARYEHEAQALLDGAADNPASLHRVVSLYFITESAKTAALRLIDLYFEDGDFPAAAWLGGRLLRLHPTLGADRPKVLFRTALAYHLAGYAAQAKEHLDELTRQHPDALGTVRGQDVNLAQLLADELQHTPPPSLRGATPDSWPTAFGSADRTRVPAASASFGARLYSVELAPPAVRGLAGVREIEVLNEQERSRGGMTGIMPVLDRGEMFFQDNAFVYAVNLESGTPLPGWAETYSGDRGGRYTLSGAWPTPRGLQNTLTVTDDAVFAVMGLADILTVQRHAGGAAAGGRGDSRLVCLDRRTGRERWIASSRTLPAEAGVGRTLDFTGCPLVVGDTVYVMGRGGKGVQFEDAYVLAFDAATGQNKWICYVASANAGFWDFGDPSGIFSPRVSHLSYWGGRLYANTNIGAVASIDAHDGAIEWLNLYPRDVTEPNRLNFNPAWQHRMRSRTGGGGTRPWTFNPILISGGKVFALPADGLHVMIYDAATGREEGRIPLNLFEDAHTLLGVVDDRLVVAGAKSVFCINWPDFDASRGRDPNLHWPKTFMKGGYDEDAIRGRGFVTADSVYIPTAWALHRISLKSGAVVENYPASGAGFGDEEGPGNILALQDRLVVAGANRVNVYTDLAMAMRKLDAAVAAAPNQPEPRLRYAEIMSVAGRWDVALQKLDEAMQLIGGAGAATPSPARDRLFADALAFAQRVMKEGDPMLPVATALFDRAAVAAHTPPQQVNYRLTRARVLKGKASPADELALYQEILADAQMRNVPVASGDAGTRPAGAVAEQAITQILARSGRAVYEPFEAAAATRLEAARQQADPAPYLALAREYPNAQAAPAALRAAADAYESAHNPRLAAQVLRLLLFKYPRTPDRAQVIESLARNYLAMPNRLDVAIARLAQGAREDEGARLAAALTLPDGRTLAANTDFDDAVAALRELKSRSAASLLPDLHLRPAPPPEKYRAGMTKFLPEGPASAIEGVAALVLPVEAEFARNDRVAAHLPQHGFAVFEVGQTRPLFTSNALQQPATNLAWMESSLAVWSPIEVALLGADDGSARWKTAVGGLPGVEVVPGPPAVEQTARAEELDEKDLERILRNGRVRMLDGQNIIIEGGARLRVIRRNGQVRIVQLGGGAGAAGGADGGDVDQNARLAAAAEAAAAGPEQVAFVRPLSDRVIVCTTSGRVVALDLADGNVLWQTRPSDRGPTHFLASDDFVVLRLEDGLRVQLVVLDALSGQFLNRRNFSNEDGAGMVPINVALAPDGTLVWIQPDRICGKDLFEPGDGLTFEQQAGGDANQSIFTGSVAPEHLQIADGRIFVLADNGRRVRIYSLETGEPLRNDDTDVSLATGASPWQAIMRPIGRRLYVATPQQLQSFFFDEDRLLHSQQTMLDARTALRPRDVIVSRHHVLVVAEPGAAAAGAAGREVRPNAKTLQLVPISRELLDGDSARETGFLEESHTIAEASSILDWQPVDGGFYYLSGDQKLHFLKGARDDQ